MLVEPGEERRLHGERLVGHVMLNDAPPAVRQPQPEHEVELGAAGGADVAEVDDPLEAGEAELLRQQLFDL